MAKNHPVDEQTFFTDSWLDETSFINEMDKTKNEFIDFRISLNNRFIIGNKQIEEIAKN